MTISNIVVLHKEDKIEDVGIVESKGRIYIHIGNCTLAMDKDQFVELANLLFARVLADKQEEMKPISVVINDTMKMEDKIG
jgi:alanyl-tRNA synthetase